MNTPFQLTNRIREALSEIYEAFASAAEWLEEGEITRQAGGRRGPGSLPRLPGARAHRNARHRRAGRTAGQAG